MSPNKNRQFAPARLDAKTAARFRRRCGKRYAANPLLCGES